MIAKATNSGIVVGRASSGCDNFICSIVNHDATTAGADCGHQLNLLLLLLSQIVAVIVVH